MYIDRGGGVPGGLNLDTERQRRFGLRAEPDDHRITWSRGSYLAAHLRDSWGAPLPRVLSMAILWLPAPR